MPTPKIVYKEEIKTTTIIEKDTIKHYLRSIKMCNKLDIPIYSFHAGFRIDPKPKELGKKFVKKNLQNRNQTLEKFLQAQLS